jgi:hypothetical protein
MIPTTLQRRSVVRDTFVRALKSPGAQRGNGHYASANSYHVDYAQALPQIVDMQRFYAQRQDTHDIAEKLGELERLMRSGTPTASGSRLSQRLRGLSSILGAYPGVVRVLQQAARMAGFGPAPKVTIRSSPRPGDSCALSAR